MNKPLVLTIDCGTQSIRALLFDKQGNIVGKSQQKYPQPYYSLKPGWAEQKFDFYWEYLCKATNELKQSHLDVWDDIVCVTVAPFRDSYTCVDKDGKPLRDIILWLDQREAECAKPLPFSSRFAFKLIGMDEALRVQRRITKSNWIKENEPDVWDKTYKYIGLGGLFTIKLTGEICDSSAANIGHVPFDYKSKVWKKTSDIQFPMFGVEEDKLPRLVAPLQTMGNITAQASKETGIKQGLPLISTGSDKGCETLGLGVVASDCASLSFGTSATVQISTKEYVEPSTFMPAYPAVIPSLYNPEIQIFRGYWMVSWFLKEFAEKEVAQAKEMGCSAEELLNLRLESIPAGCQGLMLQPYWSPLLKQPEGRGSIIGFSASHTRIHIYRAIIEGIGYALYDGLLQLQKRSKHEIKYICVAGGGSQSDVICQITADLFGLPVRRGQTYETTGLGSSIAGFVAMDEYNSFDEAIKNMVHYKDEFKPNMETHQIYRKLYDDIYVKTYDRLKPLYLKLYEILKIK